MRKRFKIPMLVVAGLVLLIAGVAVWLVRTNWLEMKLAYWANQGLAARTSLRIDIGAVEGKVFKDLVLRDVVLTSRDNPAETLVVLPHLRAEYDIRRFWRRQWHIEHLSIDSLRLFVPGDSVLQTLRSYLPSSSPDRVPAGFDFQVDSLVVSGARIIRLHDRKPVLDSIELAISARRSGSELTARLNRLDLFETALGHLSAAGRFRLQGRDWTVDSAVFTTPRSVIHASGTSQRWEVSTDPIDLADVQALFGKGPSGEIRFNGSVVLPAADRDLAAKGTVSGALDRFGLKNVGVDLSLRDGRVRFRSINGRVCGTRVRGSGALYPGQAPPRYSFSGTLRNFDLSRWAPGSFPSHLTGHAEIAGEGFSMNTFALDVDATLGPGSINRIRLDSAIGRMAVTTSDIIFADDFRVQVKGTRIIGGGWVEYTDSSEIFANFYCPDLRPWDSLVFIDSLAGRADGYFYLAGETRDPDLAGRVLSDSIRLYGITTPSFEAWFRAPHFMSRPTGTVDVRFGASSLWGWAADSIQVRASLSNRVVRLDSVSLSTPEVVINARGELDWSADTIPLVLFPLTARWEDQVFAAADTVAIGIDRKGFDFQRINVASEMGELQVSGRVDFDQRQDLEFSVDGVPIGPTWHRLFPGIDLDGQFAGNGDLRGSFALPEWRLDGTISHLTYEEQALGDLSGTLTYRHRRLQTDKLTLEHPDYKVNVSGMFPLSMAFKPARVEVLDEPLVGQLSASGERLDLVSHFLPETVESIQGPFSVSAVLGGTPRAPHVTGDAYLRSGVVKTVDVINPIEDLHVDLLLRQDTIEIRRAVGQMRDRKKRGTLTAGGQLRILSYNKFDYDLTLKGRDIPARFEFEDFYVETDFDLTVTGATSPLVKGTISPHRVVDRIPFDEEEPVVVPDTTAWDWDMVIELPGNYWIHNDQIDAELSADLRLLRNRGRLSYLGTAEIIRGRVYLFDRTGRISRGILTFDNVNDPDPRLDIDVGFRISQARPDLAVSGAGRQEIELKLHVSGRASEPLILSVDPKYTEQDVLLLLTANSTFGGGDVASTRDPWADRLKFAATGLFFSEAQRVVARKLGLETLEINSGSDPTDTEITVGRYFSPHLYLYGSSPIDAGGGQEVGFEYRFNRRLYLEGNRDKNNLYRLNVHFNWDY